jgi:precorrin-3B synthase
VNAIVPKGWCPSLYQPMASGDGLLVRVKPPGAVLTADAARLLAQSAARYGNGGIELTSRAAIQVRGLTQDGVARFAAAMVDAGLADSDPEVERRRAVIVSPLAGDDVRAVAAAVETTLIGDPRLAILPPKFAVAVDGGGWLPLGDVGAPIHVACGEGACAVTLRGTGDTVTVAAAEVAETVARLALTPVDPALRRPPPRRVQAIGWFPCDGGKASAHYGRTGAPASTTSMRATRKVVDADLRRHDGGREPVADERADRFLAEPEYGAFGVGLPFGTFAAALLPSLAALSEQSGDGTLRVSPWRALLFAGVPAAAVAQLLKTCAALGLIADPADPRLAVIACPGQPACASATVPARADAEQLAALGMSGTLHVSGCAKGCAHPGPARITLVGELGRYGIVRNGRASDTPSARRMTIDQVIAALRP